MTNADLIQFWGRDRLKRWSLNSVQSMRIPQSSRHFLTEVGLPLIHEWTVVFDDAANDLPSLIGKPNYRRIGLDYEVPICLDEMNNGTVVVYDPSVVQRYVNANVQLFAFFLTFYEQYRTAVRLLSDAESVRLISRIENDMKGVDPSAFTDVENWWPVILEQMKHGLL